jgi:hypothetical protein
VPAERSWVVASEVNRFIWPGSDLRAITRGDTDCFDHGLQWRISVVKFLKDVRGHLTPPSQLLRGEEGV